MVLSPFCRAAAALILWFPCGLLCTVFCGFESCPWVGKLFLDPVSDTKAAGGHDQILLSYTLCAFVLSPHGAERACISWRDVPLIWALRHFLGPHRINMIVTWYEHATQETTRITLVLVLNQNNRCFQDPARPKSRFVFRGQQHLQDHRCHSQNHAKVKGRSAKRMPWRWYQAGRLVQSVTDPECFCRSKDWTSQHDSSHNLTPNTFTWLVNHDQDFHCKVLSSVSWWFLSEERCWLMLFSKRKGKLHMQRM